MRILIACNVPNTQTQGAARHIHYLKKELSELGHEVDLLFAEDVPAPLGSGMTGLTFPFLILLPIIRLTQTKGRYDIIEIHSLSAAVYVFLRRIFRQLPPCVILSEGSDELRWEVEKEEEKLGYRHLGWKTKLLYYNLIVRQTRYATRYADHVIAPNNSEKEFYVRAYNINENKISMISHGVAQEFFQSRNYNCKPKSLLFVGGWQWIKGIRYLIEAFIRVAESIEEVTLSLVGVGQSESDVLQAFPNHLRKRIQVIPHVSAEEMPKVYASCDIFVFPSLFEAGPLVLPEAMASGMAIVTTKAYGMQDKIEDGVSGFLVSPRDTETLAKRIITLLNDSALCARLGQEAQRKARELTWHNIISQTLQAYERLLNNQNRAR